MVPRGGLEPPRCHQRRILNPVRLPIPPPRHFIVTDKIVCQYTMFYPKGNAGIVPCVIFVFLCRGLYFIDADFMLPSVLSSLSFCVVAIINKGV
jgi:hypothetical protein